MERIFHHHDKWEDYKNGMWKKLPREKELELLPKVIEFTGNHEKYGSAMIEVIQHWKFACEHNLTDLNVNRRAWIGHAACCYKYGWPESLVREAWNQLSIKQQSLANRMADEAIKEWELNYYNNAETQLRIIGF